MKRLLLVLAMLLVVCASFSNALIEAASVRCEEVEHTIGRLSLPWKAGVPAILNEFAANGFSDLDSVIEKWNGTLRWIEPGAVPENYGFSNQATSRYNQVVSSVVEFEYFEGYQIPEGGFIQIHPSVKNQGAHGTCWAFATVASFESALMVQKDGISGGWSSAPWEHHMDLYDLSEQFVAFHNVDYDILESSARDPNQSDVIVQDSSQDTGGLTLFSSYNSVRYGIPRDRDFPYVKYDKKDWIVWNPTNNDWDKNLIRSTKTARIYDGSILMSFITYEEYINSIKQLLVNYGALVASFEVPMDFYYYEEGVYVPTTIKTDGGHAVTLVGWLDMNGLMDAFPGIIESGAESVIVRDPFIKDQLVEIEDYSWEATEFWVLKNSWSENWGWKGYYVVPMISEELYNFLVEEFCSLPKWMIEFEEMLVPIFEDKFEASEEIDFNEDCVVDKVDFELLLENMFTNNEKYDISVPRDGRVDQEDASRFFIIFNSMFD